VAFPVFAPLNELILRLDKDKRARWERLWMVSDARADRIHPMLYAHPVTGARVGHTILGNNSVFLDTSTVPLFSLLHHGQIEYAPSEF